MVIINDNYRSDLRNHFDYALFGAHLCNHCIIISTISIYFINNIVLILLIIVIMNVVSIMMMIRE